VKQPETITPASPIGRPISAPPDHHHRRTGHGLTRPHVAAKPRAQRTTGSDLKGVVAHRAFSAGPSTIFAMIGNALIYVYKCANVDDEYDDHHGAGEKEDDEPSLGWTNEGRFGSNNHDDCEVGGSIAAEDQTNWAGSGKSDVGGDPAKTRTMRERFNKSAYGMNPVPPKDGMHVDAEQGFGGRRRLHNLSDGQKEIVKSRLDRDAVTLT
jgi:hypothetical protein